MDAQWVDIIATVLSAVVTGILAVVGALLTRWINNHAKDEKEAKMANELLSIVSNAVLYFQQTFVDTAKKEGKWDAETASKVKQDCLDYINGKLSQDMKDYVEGHSKDISEMVETAIATLVKKKDN